MLRDLQGFDFIRPTTGIDVLASLITAMTCGLVIAWIYRRTYRGTSYAPSFVRSMVILPMITAIVILVIGNNLARAFGLVGAMSIIRFRTAVKDTHDIVFIFFTLAVGLAAGVGMHAAAWVGTIGIGLTVLVTTGFSFGHVRRDALLLEFTYRPTGSGTTPAYSSVLDARCKSYNVLSVRQKNGQEDLLLTFHVRLKSGTAADELVRLLRKVDGVSGVNLYYDDEEI